MPARALQRVVAMAAVVIAGRPVDWSAMGRFTPGPEPAVGADWKTAPCPICGCPVYVDQPTRAVLDANPGAELHCYPCVHG